MEQKKKGQGAFEYILLLAGVLLIVVIIVLLLRPLTSSQGDQQKIALCQSSLVASASCYNSTGGWNASNVPIPNTVKACYEAAYNTTQSNGYNGNTNPANCNGFSGDADCVPCGKAIQ